MPHLSWRGSRHSPARTTAGATDKRQGLSLSSLDSRLPVARALICGLLCALMLILMQATRPESAQAAKFTTGWVTGTVYFDKNETRNISEVGQDVLDLCTDIVPARFTPLCLVSRAWVRQAKRARDRSMCLKVKFLLSSLLNPVPLHWPDIYKRGGGGYCK